MRAKWSAPIRRYWKISEQMMRVMVEAPDHDTCQKYVSQVVEVIKNKVYAV